MPSEWKWAVKYDDGQEVAEKDNKTLVDVDRTKTGRAKIESGTHSVNIPFDVDFDVYEVFFEGYNWTVIKAGNIFHVTRIDGEGALHYNFTKKEARDFVRNYA